MVTKESVGCCQSIIKGTFIALKLWNRKEERSLISGVNYETKKRRATKVSRRKEIMKIKVKINKVENRKIRKIRRNQSCFYEKSNKVNKSSYVLDQEQKRDVDYQYQE